MRAVGGSMPNGTEDLFSVTESLQMFADDIGVERRTVEDWRYTANRWPEGHRKEGVSFTRTYPKRVTAACIRVPASGPRPSSAAGAQSMCRMPC
ncbi:hypothetical protein GCM10023080_079470 [Streptomyces pseudoechinosporeus]